MEKFQGIGVSSGIAIYNGLFYDSHTILVPRYAIKVDQIDAEWARFQDAVEKSAQEINTIKSSVDNNLADQLYLLDAQLLMLFDPELTDSIKKNLETKQINVEALLSDYTQSIIEKLQTSFDEFLMERSLDIFDVSRRILSNLNFEKSFSLSHIDRPVILVAPNLLPSEAIQINPQYVKAIALDWGSQLSHTAILTRSFGIPAVFGLQNMCRKIRRKSSLMIVDGESGTVFIDPDQKTQGFYQSKLDVWLKNEEKMVISADRPAQTADGHDVSVMANIKNPDEIDLCNKVNIDGVGLFRTEFLFFSEKQMMDEESQYRAYARVLEAMKDKSVSIRTLDLGGDKLMSNMQGNHNSLLGCRAIRYCLLQPEVFRTQLRALVRASVHGNLKILLPMISNIEEVEQTKKILLDERDRLKERGVDVADHIPLGVMIETPAAAVISDGLAGSADFFSIGTNDLVQYTLAVDRENEMIADLYQIWHPAIWRLLKMTVDNARKIGIKVSICGELASYPVAAVLLMSLGIDEISMSTPSITGFKHAISSLDLNTARDVLPLVLKAVNTQEVKNLLKENFGHRYVS